MSDETSRLLRRVRDGDAEARAQLFALVYDELHRVAERYMERERGDHTLQPTALVHEAYVRLIGSPDPSGESRAQFLRLAAKAMRNALVDHARARGTKKRRGERHHIELDELLISYEERSLDLLALDEALEKLAAESEELVHIVELRFFAGCSLEEIADFLGVPRGRVERRWMLARGWLHRELERGGNA